MTYWTAQQLWLHHKCQNNSQPFETIKGKNMAVVMPLHLPNQSNESSNDISSGGISKNNEEELKILHEVKT